MDYFKYPRTLHLRWSPGATDDDVYIDSAAHFKGEEVVVTEKLDGENTAMYRDGTHARSIDSKDHPSRSYMKQVHARIAAMLPENYRLNLENCYAVHSIKYTALPDWVLLFGACRESGSQVICTSWDDTCATATDLDLPLVPVLYRGLWDEKKVRKCYTGVSKCGGIQEGYVVRLARSFQLAEFPRALAKFVRAGHVQTDEHWMHKKVEVNGTIGSDYES